MLLIFNPARWRASIGRVDRNGAQGGVGWGHSLNLALSQNVNENSNASRCYRFVGCFPFGLDLRCRILVKNIWTHRHTWLMSGGEAAIVCLGLVEKCQSVTSSSDRRRFWQFEKISKESGNLRNEHLARSRKGSSLRKTKRDKEWDGVGDGRVGGWGGDLVRILLITKDPLSLRRQREIYNGIQRKENGSYFRVLCTKMSKENQNLISGFFSS